jgi:hypothetical protein
MVNITVANKSSHGTRTENVEFDVFSNRMLPAADPPRLTVDISQRTLRSMVRTVSR